MPICLPDPDFKDENVPATVVGLGIVKEKQDCKTDMNGPEVFFFIFHNYWFKHLEFQI